MEEYLTVDELGARIKFSKQTLYNMIHNGSFILGKHYLKPTHKKVLFKWSEILAWMGEDADSGEKPNAKETPMTRHPTDPARHTDSSAIRI